MQGAPLYNRPSISSSIKQRGLSPLQQLSFIYSRYSRSHRNQQWIPPHHSFQYLGDCSMLHDDRDQLYLRLQEQKLQNQRSDLIIQDLLEESRKRNKIMDQIIVSSQHKRPKFINTYGKHSSSSSFNSLNRNYKKQTKLINSNVKNISKAEKIKPTENTKQKTAKNPESTNKKLNISPQTIKFTHEAIKSHKISPKQSSAKHQIIQKLFKDEVQIKKQVIVEKPIDIQKIEVTKSVIQKPNQQLRQKIRQQQILKEEINFLKQQLNQKNKSIVQLQCEVIRLQKGEKMMTDFIAQLVEKQNMRSKSNSRSNSSSPRKIQPISQPKKIKEHNSNVKQQRKLKLDKCSQVHISPQDVKPTGFNEVQKSYSLSNQISLSIFDSQPAQNICQPSKQAQIVRLETIQTQTNTEHQQQSRQVSKLPSVPALPTKILKMDSNILGWSLEMSLNMSPTRQINQNRNPPIPEQYDMDDVQLNLSVSMPINLSIRKISGTDKPLQDTIVFNALRKQGSCQSINQIAQRQTQTQASILQEQFSQTSQNFYDYIDNTYLEWMFEKQYKELEHRKQKESEQNIEKQN